MSAKRKPNINSVPISVRLPQVMIDKLKTIARDECVGYQTILKQILEEALAPYPEPTLSFAKPELLPEPEPEHPPFLPEDPKPPLPGGLTDDDLDDMLEGIEL